MDAVPELLPAGELRLAFEDAHMSVRAHGRLRELVGDRVELVAGGDAVERLRAVKDAEEVGRIGEAAKVADAALRQIMEQGLAGRTEVSVALALERAMEDLGAKRRRFGSIVAAGPHGALPHAQPRDVEIGRDELVVIDWGAELDGYCSDCTRTLATGDVPDATLEAYDLVRQAQLAGLDAVSAGVSGRDADCARRATSSATPATPSTSATVSATALGWRSTRRRGCRSARTRCWPAGNVVTVEPGVYLPGQFGVRIEDLVVVTDTACRSSPRCPKNSSPSAMSWPVEPSSAAPRSGRCTRATCSGVRWGRRFPRDVHAFTFALAEQAREHQPELDELITRHSNDWALERIAPLERSILRVALLEMLYPDVVPGEQPIPPEGAIDEAVETAKRFCGSDAPAFINGILGAVLRERVEGSTT